MGKIVKTADAQPDEALSKFVNPYDPSGAGLTAGRKIVNDTLDRLRALAVDPDYDEEFRAPTREALDLAARLVREVGSGPDAVGSPSLGPIGDGGLTLQWGVPRRYVRLLIPADPSKAYLYSKGPDVRAVEEALPSKLRARLGWLSGQ